ncbi:hypothetical protein OG225_43240 (plasmid) [Nocardia sp. NBC_01377]|uniref:hypothetical protein n=1 Tax=Nocardia sp. NBC_01377 TaxID=2903595 RepID=UPI002F9169E4
MAHEVERVLTGMLVERRSVTAEDVAAVVQGQLPAESGSEDVVGRVLFPRPEVEGVPLL